MPSPNHPLASGWLFDKSTSCSDCLGGYARIRLSAYDNHDRDTALAQIVVLDPATADTSVNGVALRRSSQSWFVEAGAAEALAEAQALEFEIMRPVTYDELAGYFHPGLFDDAKVESFSGASRTVPRDLPRELSVDSPTNAAFALALGQGIELRLVLQLDARSVRSIAWYCNASTHPGSILRYTCSSVVRANRSTPLPVDHARPRQVLLRRPTTRWHGPEPQSRQQWHELEHTALDG